MSKTKKESINSEEKLMELYDELASQWARKVEAGKISEL